MDTFTSMALSVVIAAVGFYVLYLVIRAAVAAGITDARTRIAMLEESSEPGEHEGER